MSGGSPNYAYARVEEAADEVRMRAKTTLHFAFADHLNKVAAALKDLEWVFSDDYAPGREVDAIKAVLPRDAEMVTVIARAQETSADLIRLLSEAAATVGRMSQAELDAMHEAQRLSIGRSLRPCPHGFIDFEQCAHCRMEAKKR